MSKSGSDRNALADPSRLRPLDKDDQGIIRVVIETPKGSRNKYAFDPEEKIFELKEGPPGGYGFPLRFRVCSFDQSG